MSDEIIKFDLPNGDKLEVDSSSLSWEYSGYGMFQAKYWKKKENTGKKKLL